nr:hypothetical protein [Tanacetum cinerariifolium]
MADVNAPSSQTPTMAPPVRADDQILPHIRWVLIGKSNCYLDMEKSQSNPIYKIMVDLLKNTNFFRSFTASSTIPSIYIQQFWDTVLYDKKAGCYKCQLDEQWCDLTKETLREAPQITPVNHNQAFAAPPSIDGLIDFVNQLGYPKFERPRAPVLQILWGIVIRTNIDYTERIWEEFTQSIHTFIEDKWNLSRHTSGKKRATLIVISSIRFTKLIIHHLQRKHRFYPRPDSPLHLSNEEPVLGYLKFSAKGTKREEYLAKVTHHGKYLAGETGGVQNPPALKPTQPARKPKAPTRPSISIPVASTQPAPTSAPAKSQENKRKQATETTDKPAKAKRIKHSISRKRRQPRSSPKSVGVSEAEEVPTEEPQVADEDVDYQKALEESMKDAYALPKGTLLLVVIREPESRKYQPLLEVPGKGKAKVTEEQVAHDLLSLQKHKKTSHADQYIFQSQTTRRNQKRLCLGLKRVVKMKVRLDQTLMHKLKTRRDQTLVLKLKARLDQTLMKPLKARLDQILMKPLKARQDQTLVMLAKVQSISSPVVYAGSDREHMDLDVADVSPQPSTKQLDEGFTTTVYPNVQENLKLAVEEPVLLEEPTSSSGTLSSLQHLKHILANLIQENKNIEERLDRHGARLYTLEQLDIPQQVSIAVSEVVMDAKDWAMQAPLRNRFRDLPKADMKEILHQRMWESDSYKSHEDHMQLFEALEKSMNRDHSEELAQDLDEARKKTKKSRESPKTPPGLPTHQPPPPLPAGPFEASRAPRASGSAQMPSSPPPSSSTNQESPSKGSATPSPSKTAASAEYQAWTTTDIRLRLSISLTPADLEIDEDMALDEQAQLSDDEDIKSAHILTVNLRQALASNYSPPPKDSLLAQTGDIAIFIDWFCKRRGITELKPQDLEGPAYEIVKVFHPDVIHLQYQMEECDKLMTDSVDDPILRYNISKLLPLGGLPGQVIIQPDFFFNKDLEYLRYGSKGRRPALSISKMKAAYYHDVGLDSSCDSAGHIEAVPAAYVIECFCWKT